MSVIFIGIADVEAVIITNLLHQRQTQAKVSASLGIPDKSFKQILLIKRECWPIVTYTQGPIIDCNKDLTPLHIVYNGIFEQICDQYISQPTVDANEPFLARVASLH